MSLDFHDLFLNYIKSYSFDFTIGVSGKDSLCLFAHARAFFQVYQ